MKQKIASLLRMNAENIMLVIGDRPSPQGIKTKINPFSNDLLID